MTHLPPHALPTELVAYEQVLDALLSALSPVPPRPIPLAQAQGRVAAASPGHPTGIPATNVAQIDGWACRALNLVGAGPLTPLPLFPAPVWLEVGQALPAGCDAVLDPDLIETQGAISLALGEVLPGQNTLRAGEHLAPDQPVWPVGRPVGAAGILLAEASGLETLSCHIPRVCLINIADEDEGQGLSSRFIRLRLDQAGAEVQAVTSCGRNKDAVLAAVQSASADVVITIGGTGRGRQDATLAALSGLDQVIAPRIGLSSGITAAVAWAGKTPVIALPGAPDGAVTCGLALLDPVMRRLSGRAPAMPVELPLLRKISSQVGMAELVLLARDSGGWLPLAVGRLSLGQLCHADGWMVVPSGDEGYPAGAVIGALPLGDWG